MPTNTSRILTTSAVARSLGVSEGTIRRLADDGLILMQRDTVGRRMFSPADVERARPIIEQRQAKFHGH